MIYLDLGDIVFHARDMWLELLHFFDKYNGHHVLFPEAIIIVDGFIEFCFVVNFL